MSLDKPPPENDAELGPVSEMNWGEDASAKGSFQITMEEGKTIDDYYYRDDQGKLQLQPSYKDQINRSQIDWWGVARDLVIIIFGAMGGAGSSALTATGVVGGSAAGTAANLDNYKKKKTG